MNKTTLLSIWNGIRDGLLMLVHRFETAELDFRPFPGSWTVAEIILHIANSENGWVRHVITAELQEWPSDLTPEDQPSLEAILKALEDVHRHSLEILDGMSDSDFHQELETPWGEILTPFQIFWHVLQHEIHHRGELSLILGILGKEGLNM